MLFVLRRSSLRFLPLTTIALALTAVAVARLAAPGTGPNPSPASATPSMSAALSDAASAPADGHASPKSNQSAGHTDPFADIVIVLAAIVFAAAAGRWLAERAGQPGVLGEVLVGMIVGNIGVLALQHPGFLLIMNMERAEKMMETMLTEHVSVDQAVKSVFKPEELLEGRVGYQIAQAASGHDAPRYFLIATAVWIFSNLGVILLLFLVGLESTVGDLLNVGPRATLVAVVGMIAPFILACGAGLLLIPGITMPPLMFLAATLCATSVGITARVFKDLNRLQTSEARVILGAAVIDDVLGLVVLAVVMGIVVKGGVDVMSVLQIVGFSTLFLGGVMIFGERLARLKLAFWRGLDPHNYVYLFPLTLAFLLAWFAVQIQLALIVGAFAAGLIIRRDMFPGMKSDHDLNHAFAPLEKLFAPIFFVLIGMEVDIQSMLNPQTLFVGGAITIAAIIGKLACGLVAGRGVDAISVGIGMVPRGEVGLIFAKIGKSLGVVDSGLFSALVMMVVVTTIITPLGLKWSLARVDARAARR